MVFEEFVPRVTRFLQEYDRPVEAVLVLDNCSAARLIININAGDDG